MTKSLVQCRSCPWRVDCVPDKDIPNYEVELHEGLRRTTIKEGIESIPFSGCMHVMACHYSKSGDEFACAGWLYNQLGVGNNIGVRIAVAMGHMPPPEVDGPQHATFEDTLPKRPRKRQRRKAGSQ